MQAVSGVTALAALAIASGAVAASASVEPTGMPALDIVYRFAFGALLPLAGWRARRWAWLAASGVASSGTAGVMPLVLISGAALAVSLAATARARRSPVAGAVVGALVAQVLLRLVWPETRWATAALALTGAAVLVASGLRHTGPAARRRVRLVALAAGVLALVALGSLALAAGGARRDLTEGVRAAEDGLAATRAGEAARAAGELERASTHLGAAESALASWPARPARALPVVGRYLERGGAVLAETADVAEAASAAASDASSDGLRFTGGRIDPAAVAAVEESLAQTLAELPGARAALAALAEEWLPGGVRSRLDRVDDRLARAGRDGEVALEAARVAPAMLGAGEGGRRSYLLIVQSPAEQRGSGGIVGAFGELHATDGKLELASVGRHRDLQLPAGGARFGPADYQARYQEQGPWNYVVNATFSPDFPTVGRVLEELYERRTGVAVDGVISVDPIAMGRLLELTGPVEVAGWPVPLTADNASEVLLFEQYRDLAAAQAAREEFLAEALSAVFGKLTSADLPGPDRIASALSPAVQRGNLLLHSIRGDEQDLLRRVKAAGAVAEVDGDYLQVVTQNASAAKIDWFQRRAVSYAVTYDPASGQVRATAEVRIENRAPASGLPPYVIGGALGFTNSAPGESRTWLSIYSPLRLNGATVDGRPVRFRTETELGRLVHSAVIAVPPGGTVTVRADLSGVLDGGPLYRLAIDQQPLINPDRVEVSVQAAGGGAVRGTPRSWRLTEGRDEVITVQFRLPG